MVMVCLSSAQTIRINFAAFALFGLATVPCPPQHAELEPRPSWFVGLGAVLDARACPVSARFMRTFPFPLQYVASLLGSRH